MALAISPPAEKPAKRVDRICEIANLGMGAEPVIDSLFGWL